MRKIGLIPVVLVSLYVTTPVLADWTFNPSTGHWYRLTTSAGTWHDAENEAVKIGGGHLVTINDAAEEQWLVTTFGFGGQNAAWIGFTDQAVEGTWVWVGGDGGTWQQTEFPQCTGPCDGVGTSYVDWHVYGDGEPNNNASGPGEDWAAIGTGIDGVHWTDYSPTSANYFNLVGVIERTVAPDVPTVSQWGLIVMAGLVAGAGGSILHKRRVRVT